jgi:hypothetical protein
MENEKERYFAAHWGQDVAVDERNGAKDGPFEVNAGTISGVGLLKISYLELTSLSDITDEDAIDVANILGIRKDVSNKLRIEWAINSLNESRTLKAIQGAMAYDYLRSKSYALPFNGKSVEELIELGWLKIRKRIKT